MNSDICNSNSYIKPIEICSAKALKILYNNFDKNPNDNKLFSIDSNTIFNNQFKNEFSDLNSSFRDNNNNFIYKYDNNKKDLCFSPKYTNNNNPYIVNCVIAKNNPYFTYDSKTKSCTLIPDLILPDNFYYKYEKNNTYIYYKNNENNDTHLFRTKNEKAFCENKWYDWFIVPNFHFGNQYEKDTGIFSKEDIRRCYKPCGSGLMPYIDINGSNICVKKNLVSNGLYSKKIDYSPLALINLIGNSSRKKIINLYYLLCLNEYNKYQGNDNNYSLNKQNIINNENIENNNEINIAINDMIESIWINIINEPTFNITNYENNIDVLTYKNPFFNENDNNLLTLRELINYDLLTDVILLHTIQLSYKYYNFITFKVFEKDNYYDKNDTSKLNYDETIKNNDYNLFNNLNIFLNNKLYNKTYIQKQNIIQRLANIFYKAINICYDNKTSFSKNILLKTKKAIENYNNNSYIKNIYSEYNKEFQNDLNLINNIIDNGFEIKYYDENNYLFIKNNYNEEINKTDSDSIKKQKQANINIIKDYINNNIVFFRIENNEIKNVCKVNQIKNKDNKCVDCDSYCITHNDDNLNTCKNDDKCKLFCSNSCKTLEEKNSGLNSNTCGKVNTDKNKDIENKNNINNIKTPLEDEELSIFPNIYTSINTGIKIFFILVIIYLCFIFYEIFGETIITLINIVFYAFVYFGYLIWYYLFGGFNTSLFNRKLNEYKLHIANERLQRISKIKFMI